MQDIALIGLSCRFPGASDLASFWSLLAEGRSAMCEPPEDRWPLEAVYSPVPKTPGRSYSRQAGFLKDIRSFDARFFGISDKEAAAMDPQQRLLLEQCWHALEDANIDPQDLVNSETGVFVGAMSNEYLHQSLVDREKITAFTGVGNGLSMLANRVSYAFNLRGISLTVDTACSSSLVALDIACSHLACGDIDLAIVAGVNLMLDPAMDIFYSQAGLISPSGYCRTFAASADGIARGEGVGVVILQRAEDVADHHMPLVYAYVAGSAVNHGGRGNGITAPNLAMQAEVIRRAHRRAGIVPSQIDYVELHGTGTQLGDPIEAHALGEALRQEPRTRPRSRPCFVGSVKTNIGHLEGAAGVAGVIKTALALHCSQIPASLHCDTINPLLRMEVGGLELVRELTPWPGEGDTWRYAGVSSFGLGGTNAHVVLKAPSQPFRPTVCCSPSIFMLPLSARSPAALGALAQQHIERIPRSDTQQLAAWCATVAECRSRFEYRLLATGTDATSLTEDLRRQAVSSIPSMRQALRSHQLPKVVFAFSGQGTQWAGMGAVLCQRFPEFDAVLAECDAQFKPFLGESLRTLMLSADDPTRIDNTTIAQPAIFSFQLAMARWIESFGMRAEAVIGHSIGEYAAAVISGVMDLPTAARLVAARAGLMHEHSQRGGMVSLQADIVTVNELLGELVEETLSIACYNGENHTTVAGTTGSVRRLGDLAVSRGIRVIPLRVTRAFHMPMPSKPLMDFVKLLGEQQLHDPKIPFASTLTGQFEREALAQPDYWKRQIVEPVRFVGAVRAVCSRMRPLWLEIGARPTLSTLLTDIEAARDCVVTATCHRRLPEDEAAMAALRELYAIGIDIDWRGHYATAASRCRVPAYPFEAIPHWHDVVVSWRGPDASSGDTSTSDFAPPSAMSSSEGAAQLSALDEHSALRQAISRVTGIDAALIKPHQALMEDLGFNSLMMAELKLDLQQRLPAAKTISMRDLASVVTVSDLALVLGQRLGEQSAPLPEKVST